MKAVVLTTYGPPEGLQVKDVAKPIPKAGEVLVKVHAASINDWDWGLVRGTPFVIRLIHGLRTPRIRVPGVDISGSVEAVGDEVASFAIGDEVYGDLSDSGFGGFAEYVCVPERALAKKPASVSHVDAAALPHAGLLALQGLLDKGKVKAGQSVLINGAGGGVGTLGIQILKSYGVKVAGVDSAAKLDVMRSQGFDSVMDYREVDFTRNGEKYDLILDTKSNRSVFNYVRCLKKHGRYVTVGGSMPRLFQILVLGSLISLFTNKKLLVLGLQPNRGLDRLSELAEKGQLKPVVDGPYGIDEIPRLIQYFGEGRHLGKIVVEIGNAGESSNE